MRTKRIRTMAFAAALSLPVGMLAACGGSDGGSNGGSDGGGSAGGDKKSNEIVIAGIGGWWEGVAVGQLYKLSLIHI